MPEIYCSKCGNTVQPTDLFCQKCGSAVSSVHTSPETIVKSRNSTATISLILGILAIMMLILFERTWANCMGPLAIIYGVIALFQIKKQGSTGKGLAIIGIVLGTLPFFITLISILLLVPSN